MELELFPLYYGCVLVVEKIEVRVCEDLINLESVNVALFIIDVCTALNDSFV